MLFVASELQTDKSTGSLGEKLDDVCCQYITKNRSNHPLIPNKAV